MDDVTAEVDEREEYSNDFESGSSRASCAMGASLSGFVAQASEDERQEEIRGDEVDRDDITGEDAA